MESYRCVIKQSYLETTIHKYSNDFLSRKLLKILSKYTEKKKKNNVNDSVIRRNCYEMIFQLKTKLQACENY